VSDGTEEARSRRTAKTFNLLGILGANGIACLLVIEAWGHWGQVAFVVGQVIAMGALNTLITARLLPRIGASATESLRAALNIGVALAIAITLDWPLESWLYLPFICVLVDGRDQVFARIRLVAVIAIWNVVAFASGASFALSATFSCIGAFCFFVAASRITIIEEMLLARVAQNAALAEAHEELKLLHAHALAQDKLAGLGLLAAGIAHEINNPMSYVTSNLNGLLEDLAAAPALTPALIEQRDEVVPGTLDGVRRVNAIVSDLRRFASGERESPMRFDLREEIEAAVRIVRTQLKPNQSIRVDFPPSLVMFGMPRQIGQVFLNLLVNSTQALADDGVVVARGRLDPEGVEVAIIDNGSGMSAPILEKLFQPFFTTKEVGQGTGLGLSVVHGIVKAHGGKIDVISQLGLGSTFTVTLPAAAAA
jgi:two-component system NtrC family sensor kinase